MTMPRLKKKKKKQNLHVGDEISSLRHSTYLKFKT